MAISIHPDTHLGAVHLTITDLRRSIDFYVNRLGLHLNKQDGSTASLGAGGRDLLVLTANPAAKKYARRAGLYHFAILFPDRRELARVIARLFASRYPNSPTDHINTKTTYLDDPDGNGIELYCESPEDGEFVIENGRFFARRADGSLSDGREPLDLDALFAHLQPDDDLRAPVPPQTKIGHIHLHVANLDAAMRFYNGVLCFDNMGMMTAFRMGMVSAGGYHHHIGFNTWQGEGAPPPPPDAAGLRYFEILLPDTAELDKAVNRVRAANLPLETLDTGYLVRDPSQNGILLTVGGTR
ncbi:MAG: VOC family protein [Caldilineaceae bacterium]|nr:VOC family protein [Caldilineaceae bacterium]